MKSWYLNALIATACASLASGADVKIEPLFGASGGAFDQLPTARFAILSTTTGVAGVTHLVSAPLQQLGDGSSGWYGADYKGVSSTDTTGATLETGVVTFDLDAPIAVPEGSVSSGIIAVIPRSGTWAQQTTSTPTTALGGATGGATADATTISLDLSDPAVSGTLSYAVDSDGHLELLPFSLTKGGTTYNFSDGSLDPVGDGSFRGLILAKGATNFDEIAYAIEISGLADTDTTWYLPATVGSDGYIESSWFGDFWLLENNYTYHTQLHWLYTAQLNGWLVAYDFDGLGWIATNSEIYPFAYFYGVPSSDGNTMESGWLYLSPDSGGTSPVWAYFYTGSRATSGQVASAPGWWSFKAAP